VLEAYEVVSLEVGSEVVVISVAVLEGELAPEEVVTLLELGNVVCSDVILTGNVLEVVNVETVAPPGPPKVMVMTVTKILLLGTVAGIVEVPLIDEVVLIEPEKLAGDAILDDTIVLAEDVKELKVLLVVGRGSGVVTLTGPGPVGGIRSEEERLEVSEIPVLLLEDVGPVVPLELVDVVEALDVSVSEAIVLVSLPDSWLVVDVSVSVADGEVVDAPEGLRVALVVEVKVPLAGTEVYAVAFTLPEMVDVKTMVPIPLLPVADGPYEVIVLFPAGNGGVVVLVTAMVITPEPVPENEDSEVADISEPVDEPDATVLPVELPEDSVVFVVGICDEPVLDSVGVIVEAVTLLATELEDSLETDEDGPFVSVPVGLEDVVSPVT
jgi:hypothetical protein